jgi:hypothetical protein
MVHSASVVKHVHGALGQVCFVQWDLLGDVVVCGAWCVVCMVVGVWWGMGWVCSLWYDTMNTMR